MLAVEEIVHILCDYQFMFSVPCSALDQSHSIFLNVHLKESWLQPKANVFCSFFYPLNFPTKVFRMLGKYVMPLTQKLAFKSTLCQLFSACHSSRIAQTCGLIFEWLYVELGVGLNNPYGPFPAWDILSFSFHLTSIFLITKLDLLSFIVLYSSTTFTKYITLLQ